MRYLYAFQSLAFEEKVVFGTIAPDKELFSTENTDIFLISTRGASNEYHYMCF